MASETSEKPTKAGLSLYANLLDPSVDTTAPGTISRAPVVFNRSQGDDLQQEEALASKQQISAASLRFQPTKRPQLTTLKPKSKPVLSKSIYISSPSIKDQETLTPEAPNGAARSSGKSTLKDWAAEDDETSGLYLGEKRQRGGRKKRKKTKEDALTLQNWDDIYDPSRPNSYDEYKHSAEKILEMRDWKDRLYVHRLARSHSSDVSEYGELNKQHTQELTTYKPHYVPASISNNVSAITIDPIESTKTLHNPSFTNVNSQNTGLSEPENNDEGRSKISLGSSNLSPGANPPRSPLDSINISQSSSLTLHNQLTTAPLPPTISRAPVRYNLSLPPSELTNTEAEIEDNKNDEVEHEAPRSLRPGQQGFAERLMSKYGWTKGTGLGAGGTGIVNPLRVQVEKQKRKADLDGGGFVGPGGKGKIVGEGNKGGSSTQETGRFGNMSEVVILRGMVDGMDLDAELEGAGDGGLIQEIGEECGEKYGRVERVYIDRTMTHKPLVFVKFTSQLSALRAVNALEQRIFNGNTITARFYDLDKFEACLYS